jgi:hypothetical protein
MFGVAQIACYIVSAVLFGIGWEGPPEDNYLIAGLFFVALGLAIGALPSAATWIGAQRR